MCVCVCTCTHGARIYKIVFKKEIQVNIFITRKEGVGGKGLPEQNETQNFRMTKDIIKKVERQMTD